MYCYEWQTEKIAIASESKGGTKRLVLIIQKGRNRRFCDVIAFDFLCIH